MTFSHVIAFLIGMVGSVPGSYFGILWYMGRSLRKVTPRQRELLAEIRRGIDEARRELVGVPDHAAARARAIDLRLSVLRAGEEKLLVSQKGATMLRQELHVTFHMAQDMSAFHLALEPLGLAGFNAHTLELTFQLARHEEKTEESR